MALMAVALLVAIGGHAYRNPEEVAQFRRLSPLVLFGAVVSQTLVQIFMNWALLIPLRRHLRNLGFWEFLLVRSGGLVASSVVPVAGGMAVRLAYLRRRGLTYSDFLWATIVANVFALVAAAILAVAASAVMWWLIGQPPLLVFGLAAAIALGAAAAVLLTGAIPRLAAHGRLGQRAWVAALSEHSLDRSTALGVVGASLLRHIMNFVTFGLLYGAITRSPQSMLTGGLVYALTSPVRMVNITPGNVGVNEWVVAVVGGALAFDVTVGLIVAIVFRGVSVVAQAFAGVVAWAWVEVAGDA
ncbi:MAG: lysylphosphatidylglycerol synthase domain-containing protein [Vicinamibacterales bacterium]